MVTFDSLTKKLTLFGLLLGILIAIFYSSNNKIGDSGIVYLILILIISTLYGFSIGKIYNKFKNKNFLNPKGIIIFIIILIILTGLMLFLAYVLIFALDFIGPY